MIPQFVGVGVVVVVGVVAVVVVVVVQGRNLGKVCNRFEHYIISLRARAPVCMYVCKYACTYAYTYVRMFLRMYVCARMHFLPL